MGQEYNSKTFTPEQVKEGLHWDLLHYLLDYNERSCNSYYDIHINNDGYCTTIEWAEVFFNSECGVGKFEFIDQEHQVFKIVKFPDNHIEYLLDSEASAALHNWGKEEDK